MNWSTFISEVFLFAKQHPEVVTTVAAILVGGPIAIQIIKLLLKHFETQTENARDKADEAVEKAKNSEKRAKEAEAAKKVAEADRTDAQAKAFQLQLKLDNVKDAFANQHGDMWLRRPISMPFNYVQRVHDSIPIILCANLKGGVGKTTVSANLAEYFQVEHNERVLAIDLDYQGSLSSMLLDRAARRTRASSKMASMLISGNATGQWLNAEAMRMSQAVTDSRVADCFYEFATYETKLTVDWLLGDAEGDIRYNLANVLLSPDVQCRFDRIIIDVPPRVTAGFINALCASSHLVVPTMLDNLAAEAVGTFLRYLRTMNTQLFPALKLVGVAGTMKRFATDRTMDSEDQAFETLRRSIAAEWGSGQFLLQDGCIPRKEIIAEAAGQRPVYREARESFKPLGDAIFEATACGKGLMRPTDAATDPSERAPLH